VGCRVGKGRSTHDTAKEESPVEMDREDGQENKESVGKGRQRREQGNGVSGRTGGRPVVVGERADLEEADEGQHEQAQRR